MNVHRLGRAETKRLLKQITDWKEELYALELIRKKEREKAAAIPAEPQTETGSQT